MKNRKIKIAIFGILTIFVSGFLLLILFAITLIPTVRKYTVTNETNDVIYVTPLMQSGVFGFSVEESPEYIEQVKDFHILRQYLTYHPPAFPSFYIRDIKINPNSETVFHIEYEDIKQESGPQILLIKDSKGNYFYQNANFWESDVITNESVLNMASSNIINAKERGRSTLKTWLKLLGMIGLIVLFPYLFIRNLRKQPTA